MRFRPVRRLRAATRKSEHARPLGEQRMAAHDDERVGKRLGGEGETEIRADAGGFARGDARLASELVLDVRLVAQAPQPELRFFVGLRLTQRRERALAAHVVGGVELAAA